MAIHTIHSVIPEIAAITRDWITHYRRLPGGRRQKEVRQLRPTCSATKRDGEPCTLPATGQQDLCWGHAPENAAARKRTAARGGRARNGKQINWIWDAVTELIAKVEEGAVKPSDANAMIRGFNVLIAQKRLELDAHERSEIQPMLDELAAKRRNDRGWQ